jgi:hypothetical protein
MRGEDQFPWTTADLVIARKYSTIEACKPHVDIHAGGNPVKAIFQ